MTDVSLEICPTGKGAQKLRLRINQKVFELTSQSDTNIIEFADQYVAYLKIYLLKYGDINFIEAAHVINVMAYSFSKKVDDLETYATKYLFVISDLTKNSDAEVAALTAMKRVHKKKIYQDQSEFKSRIPSDSIRKPPIVIFDGKTETDEVQIKLANIPNVPIVKQDNVCYIIAEKEIIKKNNIDLCSYLCMGYISNTYLYHDCDHGPLVQEFIEVEPYADDSGIDDEPEEGAAGGLVPSNEMEIDDDDMINVHSPDAAQDCDIDPNAEKEATLDIHDRYADIFGEARAAEAEEKLGYINEKAKCAYDLYRKMRWGQLFVGGNIFIRSYKELMLKKRVATEEPEDKENEDPFEGERVEQYYPRSHHSSMMMYLATRMQKGGYNGDTISKMAMSLRKIKKPLRCVNVADLDNVEPPDGENNFLGYAKRDYRLIAVFSDDRNEDAEDDVSLDGNNNFDYIPDNDDDEDMLPISVQNNRQSHHDDGEGILGSGRRQFFKEGIPDLDSVRKIVDDWHRYIKPIISQSEETTSADTHHYFDKILQKFPENNGKNTMTFKEVVAGESRKEIVQMFTSSLTLVNAQNLQIGKPNIKAEFRKMSLEEENFELTLLSRVLHHETLQANIAQVAS